MRSAFARTAARKPSSIRERIESAPAAAAGFITTDSVSYIFTLVIVWIASRLDGILEDQLHYLRRLNNQPEQ